VAGAWLIMILGGRWRPARGWIEWFGRALGVAWLLEWIVPTILRAFLR